MENPDSIENPNNVAPVGAFSIEAFCEFYGIGRTHAFGEIKAGRLRARKSGRRTIVLRSDAEAWAQALPERTAADAA
ncbi:Phage excisionase (fragment) [Mesorhizobium sp. ORS 3359]